MLLLLFFAFLAGVVTILAPCIWPVLPIVLSSSVSGSNHKKPLGITLGVILSFTFFTLFITFLVKAFHLNPNTLRIVAFIIISFLGLTMIIPALGEKFELFVSKLSGVFSKGLSSKDTGFLSGFITGLSLGVVWSPCAGPILATIAALAAVGQVSLGVIFVTLAYVTGVGVPLFAFAYGGQRFINKTRGLNSYTGKIPKVFGVIMILAAVAIYTNADQSFQLTLLSKFPVLGSAVNGFENSKLVTNQLNILKQKPTSQIKDTGGLFNASYPAPDFIGGVKWLNTNKPISIKDLKGKVVLVDFWTYTCINCIRTLPFVTSWYDKYSSQGFVVIGVHTPEFQFEHDTDNVLGAIKRYSIHYPVVQDNDYLIWNKFNNEYWPAEYLVDANGTVRRTHFGEGEYDQTEKAIQALLKESGKKVNSPLTAMPDQTPTGDISPETYLGSDRMEFYYPSGNLKNGTQNFSLSDSLPTNSFSYGGTWAINSDNATSGAGAVLSYNFSASKVYIILSPAGPDTTVKIFMDGKVADPSFSGSDVKNGVITVDSQRLYSIIDLHGKNENHLLRLEFNTPGTKAYTFTFG